MAWYIPTAAGAAFVATAAYFFLRAKPASSPSCKSVPNPNRGRRREAKEIKWVVLHDTEGGTRAEDVAAWMATTRGEKAVSVHLVVDDRGGCARSVDDVFAVWGAGSREANDHGLQIELVTPSGAAATWTSEQWLGRGALLDTAARAVATWCRQYGIPVQFVDAEGLRTGRSGITTHAEVTKAFSGGVGHFDPGSRFPMSAFLSKVAALR